MTEKPFSGFPAGAEITPIPNLFFAKVMPQIEDITELKIVLHVFWLLSYRRCSPQFVTFGELLSDPNLIGIIRGGAEDRDEMLRNALHLAVQHGILLDLRLYRDGEPEDVYFINNEAGRRTVDRVERGKFVLPGLIPKKEEKPETSLPSDIFKLYEQNIGMITPIIAEELQGAEKLYPSDWIESAFKEAVILNKRSWKYIAHILERWAVEGKSDGKFGRYSKKEGDPDKYIRGKYGHMVKR